MEARQHVRRLRFGKKHFVACGAERRDTLGGDAPLWVGLQFCFPLAAPAPLILYTFFSSRAMIGRGKGSWWH